MKKIIIIFCCTVLNVIVSYWIVLSILFLYMFVSSSDSKYSKENHKSTSKIDSSLYLEDYRIPGYMMTTGSTSCYITDSVHFRKHIATIDDHYEWLIFEKIEPNEIIFFLRRLHDIPDSIIVCDDKSSRVDVWFDTIPIANYNIQELIGSGKFE